MAYRWLFIGRWADSGELICWAASQNAYNKSVNIHLQNRSLILDSASLR